MAQIPTISDRFKTIIAAISGAGGIIAGIEGALKALHGASPLVSLVIAGVLLIAGLLFLRDVLRNRSRLNEPSRFVLDNRNPRHLIGRDEEIRKLAAACLERKQVFLLGESGIGKSALLRSGLRNYLLEQNGRLLPIYLDAWQQDWEGGPRAALAEAIWDALSEEQRARVKLNSLPEPDQCGSALCACRSILGKTPLIIFDQFDDYQIQHYMQFISGGDNAWLTPQRLIETNSFWREMRQLLDPGTVHVLFAVRAEAKQWLTPFNYAEHDAVRLHRISARDFETLLAQISKGSEEAPIISNPERGWTGLVKMLVNDLAQDGGVLPIQARVALQGLRFLPALTRAEYSWVGGLPGVETGAIQFQIAQAATDLNIRPDFLYRALRALVDPVKLTTIPRTTSELNQHISNSSDGEIVPAGELDSIEVALQGLQVEQIVRKSLHPETHEPVWVLDHEYLCSAVLDASNPRSRWSRLLVQQYNEFNTADHWLSRWRSLLSLKLQLSLLYQYLRGRVEVRVPRSYILISLLRVIPALLPFVLVGLVLAEDAGARIPGAALVRDYLYFTRLSVFQDIPNEHQLESEAAQTRRSFARFLETRFVADWFQPGEPLQSHVIHEPWIQAQAVAGVWKAPESGSELRKQSLRALDSLLAARVDTSFGSHYGWRLLPENDYTTVEPALWNIAGMSLIYHNVDWATGEHYEPQLYDTQRIAMTYYADSGAWNMFPNQIEPHLHSTYSTALALLALLEVRRSALGWHDIPQLPHSRADARRDSLLRSTAGWLVRSFTRDGGSAGWRARSPASRSDGISEGLTLQILAELLSARQEGGVPIPAEILNEVPRVLSRVQDRTDIREKVTSTNWHGTTFHDMDGNLDTIPELPVRFLWYPWAVECATRWLAYAQQGNRAPWRDIVRVSRIRDRLVANGPLQSASLGGHPDAFTFIAVEMIYGFSAIGSADAGTRPRIGQQAAGRDTALRR